MNGNLILRSKQGDEGTRGGGCRLNPDFNKIKKMNRIKEAKVRRCHLVRAKKMNHGNPDNPIEIVVQTMQEEKTKYNQNINIVKNIT
jgi:hypothetical protein